jgi:uncharacterized protein YndB with AHSA1/START domain
MITIQTTVHASLENAWNAFTLPEAITQWNFAGEEWHCPHASNDLQVGGVFYYRMEARDGSMGFDFGGTYTEIIPHQLIRYVLGDERTVEITFEKTENGILVTEKFDPENQNPHEMQQMGWQMILDRYKTIAECWK